MERKQHVREVKDGDFVRRERVVEFNPNTRNVIVSRVNRFLALVSAVLTGLLAFRFILKLLAANAANGFVDFIYDITSGLASPFEGIINSPAYDSGAIIDTAALFAIVVYVLAIIAIATLIRIVFTASNASRSVSTIERDS
jgi:hypothetical protein